MPIESEPPLAFRRSVGTLVAREVGIAAPWVLCVWLDYAIACHRWTEWAMILSLTVSASAAVRGWHLVRRAAERYDDAGLGDLLAHVPDAPPWALFSHPVHTLKNQHTTRCQRRWGVTTRTSGWQRFRRSWRSDAGLAVVCLACASHALWLGLGVPPWQP